MKNDEDKRLEKKKLTRLLLEHNTSIMEADAGKLELIAECANLVALTFYYKFKYLFPEEKIISHSIQMDIIRMDNVRRRFFSMVTKHIWVQNEQCRDIFETCPCQVIKELLENKA